MLSSHYIEDIFIKFYDLALIDEWPMQPQDLTASGSFYSVIIQGKELTQNQANFILKLLAKYQNFAVRSAFDYRALLQDPKWKHPFRVLDLSKKIFVEKDSDGTVWVCAKFPYQLKKEFDSEFEDKNLNTWNNSWDHEKKLRKFSVYDINLIQLYEFSIKNNFEIDETFMITLGEVEEIWQNQEDVLPFSTVDNNVVLHNCSEETKEWFQNNSNGEIYSDLLLAKSMGYLYRGKPQNIVEKIASTSLNTFWIKTNKELLNLYSLINDRMVIVLDRTANRLEWLDQFLKDSDEYNISRDDIRVCFRENKDQHTGLNEWIKLNGVGGSVAGGRIIIFESKPAKWLFKEQEHVKIVVSNNLYPATNQLTKDWFNSCPCVIYLGDIKPSEQRGQKIVEL